MLLVAVLSHKLRLKVEHVVLRHAVSGGGLEAWDRKRCADARTPKTFMRNRNQTLVDFAKLQAYDASAQTQALFLLLAHGLSTCELRIIL
jgi:hypothetical protein